MPGGGHYRSEWDNYAKSWERQLFQDESSKLVWPGDEWGTEQSWRCIFEMMFLDLGAAGWKNCVEIGAGSGKYTQLLLDHSASDIVVFDISPAYLEVLKVRLASFIESGRVDHPQCR